jgi:opacity protein-like surface antigen
MDDCLLKDSDMRTLNIALLATVAAAALTTATVAADPVVMVSEPAPMMMDAATGWDGPYAGIFVLGQTGPAGGFGIGVNAGLNMDTSGMLLGVEGDIAYIFGNHLQGQAVGRVGVMISDGAAIYALAGFGASSGTGAYVPVGVGVEFAVADNMSIKAQYEYHWDIDSAAQQAHVGKIGLNWHF